MPASSEHELSDLYRRYGHAVYRRCQYFLRNEADARDAMHDVFVKAMEHLEDFKGESSPLTWLVRITTNHCLNILRARRAAWKDRYKQTVNVDRAARTGHDFETRERAELIYAILPKLDPKLQAVAVYYYVDEMTQEDAAQAVQCSLPTLRKRLRNFIAQARKELRKLDLDFNFEDP